MAKLVGVYHDEANGGKTKINCLARRQLPLTIESDLTMIMALDDACLACCSTTLETSQDPRKVSRSSQLSLSAQREREAFLKKYDSMSLDEVSAALMVTFKDLMSTLSTEVTCVGCRRSVESLVHRLNKIGDSALEPLVITEDGVVSVSRDHILAPHALANLFCVQLQRLQMTYVDTPHNAKNKKSVRCSAHSMGLGTKRLITHGHWAETWQCMAKECQEGVVLIHFDLLRATLDRYLKKHSFCTECSGMVNRAYSLLIRSDGDRAHSPEAVTSTCQALNATTEIEDDPKSDNLYQGITACTADQHIHVDCATEFISKLINLAEPEINGLKLERHAKTMEIAKKEVLTCIGICLYDRIQRIQQRLREGQQSCDILFLIALKSLKKSYDVAFENKQGISDLEKLCQEFDAEEKRKLEKAQKKRDNKKNKLKKKKDNQDDEIHSESMMLLQPQTTTDCKENVLAVSAETLLPDSTQNKFDFNESISRSLSSSSRSTSSESVKKEVDESSSTTSQSGEILTSRLTCVASVCRKTTRLPSQPNNSFSILSLERMLDGLDEQDLGDDSGEEGIPLEEIQNFHARQSDVSQQREELRKNLRQRFAQFCGNGL